jgi:hypothetical protein
MKKLLLLSALLLINVVMLTVFSCREVSPEERHQVELLRQTAAHSKGFVLYDCESISRVGDAYILVDKTTRVQYLYIVDGYRASLSVMLDSVGKPILYTGELPTLIY